MRDPSVTILADPDALALAAARRFVDQVQAAVAERSLATVVLAGGSTPLALYRLLTEPPWRESVPWTRTHFFWGDERAVPPDHPDSNYRQAAETLLSPVLVPPAHVHRMQGELSPEAAAAAYRAELVAFQTTHDRDAPRSWPRFDLVLLGLGSDGHTASLFPGSPVEEEEPVRAVTGDYEGRPAQRITLTPLAFNDARQIDFLVTGEAKADAIRATLQGDQDPQAFPAQRIQPAAGEVRWLLDEAAASRLR